MCSNAVRKKSHCGLLFSAALCTGGRRKEQVGGPFERRRPERCAASAALPHHHCLICNESSIQSESDEVCQGSGFRVKCVLFHLSSPTRVTSLPLSLSPPHASSPRCLKLKLFNSRRGLRSRLWWGDGAHTFFWLRCQLPLSLPSLSWLQTGDLTQK